MTSECICKNFGCGISWLRWLSVPSKKRGVQIRTKKAIKLLKEILPYKIKFLFADVFFGSLWVVLTAWYHSNIFVGCKYNLRVPVKKFMACYQAAKIVVCFLKKTRCSNFHKKFRNFFFGLQNFCLSFSLVVCKLLTVVFGLKTLKGSKRKSENLTNKLFFVQKL